MRIDSIVIASLLMAQSAGASAPLAAYTVDRIVDGAWVVLEEESTQMLPPLPRSWFPEHLREGDKIVLKRKPEWEIIRPWVPTVDLKEKRP